MRITLARLLLDTLKRFVDGGFHLVYHLSRQEDANEWPGVPGVFRPLSSIALLCMSSKLRCVLFEQVLWCHMVTPTGEIYSMA